MVEYLYHGIKWWDYDLLVKIIESGYLKPRCMLEPGLITDNNNIFNGTKYLSLTEKVRVDGGRSSYDERIWGNPCFVLKRDNLDLIHPRYVEMDFLSDEEQRKILFSDNDERYSYYEDEVQVKDKISLKSNLVAIGLPMYDLDGSHDNDSKLKLFGDIKRALLGNDIDVPIVNSSVFDFADNDEAIEKTKILTARS